MAYSQLCFIEQQTQEVQRTLASPEYREVCFLPSLYDGYPVNIVPIHASESDYVDIDHIRAEARKENLAENGGTQVKIVSDLYYADHMCPTTTDGYVLVDRANFGESRAATDEAYKKLDVIALNYAIVANVVSESERRKLPVGDTAKKEFAFVAAYEASLAKFVNFGSCECKRERDEVGRMKYCSSACAQKANAYRAPRTSSEAIEAPALEQSCIRLTMMREWRESLLSIADFRDYEIERDAMAALYKPAKKITVAKTTLFMRALSPRRDTVSVPSKADVAAYEKERDEMAALYRTPVSKAKSRKSFNFTKVFKALMEERKSRPDSLAKAHKASPSAADIAAYEKERDEMVALYKSVPAPAKSRKTASVTTPAPVTVFDSCHDTSVEFANYIHNKGLCGKKFVTSDWNAMYKVFQYANRPRLSKASYHGMEEGYCYAALFRHCPDMGPGPLCKHVIMQAFSDADNCFVEGRFRFFRRGNGNLHIWRVSDSEPSKEVFNFMDMIDVLKYKEVRVGGPRSQPSAQKPKVKKNLATLVPPRTTMVVQEQKPVRAQKQKVVKTEPVPVPAVTASVQQIQPAQGLRKQRGERKGKAPLTADLFRESRPAQRQRGQNSSSGIKGTSTLADIIRSDEIERKGWERKQAEAARNFFCDDDDNDDEERFMY